MILPCSFIANQLIHRFPLKRFSLSPLWATVFDLGWYSLVGIGAFIIVDSFSQKKEFNEITLALLKKRDLKYLNLVHQNMLHFDIKVDKQLRMKGLTNSDVVLLKDAIEEVSRSEKSKARI